jgi:hypothetical protein
MRDRKRFASTMLSLSLSLKMYGRELSGPMQEVYWTALADLTDEEFARAAEVLIRRETEFPPPAMFLAVARPQRDLAAEAFQVLNRCLLLTTYDPEGGTSWSGRQIQAEVSQAAYEAFHACGGAPAFRLYDDPIHGPRVRREFVECYQRVVRSDAQLALPGDSDRPVAALAAYTAGIGRPMPALPRGDQ